MRGLTARSAGGSCDLICRRGPDPSPLQKGKYRVQPMHAQGLPRSDSRHVLRVMAKFGPFLTVKQQIVADPRFSSALAYLVEALQAGSAANERIAQVQTGA